MSLDPLETGRFYRETSTSELPGGPVSRPDPEVVSERLRTPRDYRWSSYLGRPRKGMGRRWPGRRLSWHWSGGGGRNGRSSAGATETGAGMRRCDLAAGRGGWPWPGWGNWRVKWTTRR
jgi:hypothetical protein